jgi:hypothetical protein
VTQTLSTSVVGFNIYTVTATSTISETVTFVAGVHRLTSLLLLVVGVVVFEVVVVAVLVATVNFLPKP